MAAHLREGHAEIQEVVEGLFEVEAPCQIPPGTKLHGVSRIFLFESFLASERVPFIEAAAPCVLVGEHGLRLNEHKTGLLMDEVGAVSKQDQLVLDVVLVQFLGQAEGGLVLFEHGVLIELLLGLQDDMNHLIETQLLVADLQDLVSQDEDVEDRWPAQLLEAKALRYNLI